MRRSRRGWCCFVYFCMASYFIFQVGDVRGDGFFDNLREDVRSTETAVPQPVHEGVRRDKRRHRDHDDEGLLSDSFAMFLGLGTLWVVSSPFWGPAAMVGDSYDSKAYFAEFPYAKDREGSLVLSGATCDCGALLDGSEHAPYCASNFASSKTYSGRFSGEWAEQPGDISRVGGRLQLSMSSRFGLDTQMDWLREPGSGPVEDELWLGDCNVVFRFAQSERVQFYTGAGFNWLDDPIDTNFGFNFTYGADFFPRRPWVVSSSIDWGNLGRAEQFRFRTTAGLMVNRFEVYAGYEYLDIDRTQMNMYVTGVRIWF